MPNPGADLTRPIGWWLKEADARLNAAFETALQGTGVSRRGWQLLTSLARGPVPKEQLIGALSAFDSRSEIEADIAELRERGWLVESADELVQVTSPGTQQQQALAPLVGAARQQVSAALPEQDYAQLISLLSRLVEGLQARREW